MSSHEPEGLRSGRALLIDTSTRRGVLALGDLELERLVALRSWPSNGALTGSLFEELEGLFEQGGQARSDLAAVIVGVGPGSFTGLRVGMSLAKTAAHGLRLPIVGVSSTMALATAVARVQGPGRYSVVLPAGARDIYLHRLEQRPEPDEIVELEAPQIANSLDHSSGAADARWIAADFGPPDRTRGRSLPAHPVTPSLPAAALERGAIAAEGFADALFSLGARRLRDGRLDDVSRLVPSYVALPRGVSDPTLARSWVPEL